MSAMLILLMVLSAGEPPPQRPASAQAPAGKPAAGAGQAKPGQGWSYDPQGRRDPFISLRNRGSDVRSAQNRPPGIAGVAVGEVIVRGIVKNGNDFIASVQVPDGRSFQIRRNDKLFDGVVKQITFDAVVFTQEVNDPLSLVKQRDVRKTMKPGDGEEEL